MGKTITNNKLSISELDNIVPIEKGGTGSKTLEEAVTKLGLISNADKNKSNGVVGLDGSGKATSGIESDLLVADNIVLSGPSSAPVDIYVNYTIVGYSSFKRYTAYVDRGKVSVVDNTVIVRTPNTPGNMKITLNGKVYTISITSSPSVIEQPTIVYPIKGTSGYPSRVTAISSSFSVIGTDVPFVSSVWRISNSPGFEPSGTTTTTITTGSGINKQTFEIVGLNTNSIYYIQVKYTSTGGLESQWSETCEVTTRTDSDFNYLEDTVIDPYTKSNNGKYGSNVIISQTGDRVVVSEYNAAIEGSSNIGKVYIFYREDNRWTLEYELIEPEEISTRFFGYSIAMNSTDLYLAISAVADPVRNPDEIGKVYIFYRSDTHTWRYNNSAITPINREYGDMFGYSVDISSSTVVVGAPKTTVDGLDNVGMVHVYKRTGGSNDFLPKSTHVPTDREEGDNFGTKVRINDGDNRFIASSPYATRSSKAKQGVVYVYSSNSTTWTNTATLQPSDGLAGDNFGLSLDLDRTGQFVAVGSKNAVRGGVKIGQVYIYQLTTLPNTWTQIDIIKSSIPSICTDFGSSLAISKDNAVLVIGSIMTNRTSMVDAGIVHTYIKKEDKWTFNSMLLASDETPSDHFGNSVSVSYNGADILVGAPNAIRYSQKTGMVYLFRGLN